MPTPPLSKNGTDRLIVSMPTEMYTWLKERSNESYSMAEIARAGVQLLIDLGWKPENEY